jgi:hypothetical protein
MARNDGQDPVTVPDFMAVQGFLADPVLDAIDASIKDVDEVLYYVGVADQYSIDTSEILESNFPSAETDVVVDPGDYYMFRAGLKAARAFMLMASAWNLDVLPFFDFEHLNPGIILARYPDLLKLNSNGPADLAKAKTAIREAVTDYVNASDRIRERNAKEPLEGTETFTQMGQCEVEKEALFRDVVERFNTALSSGEPLEMTFEEDIWTVVDDDDGKEIITLHLVASDASEESRWVLTGTLDRHRPGGMRITTVSPPRRNLCTSMVR